MVPYLDVQHLSKSFGALTLFRDISFSIGEGQKVGLIAKNGTGKSTLLSILSGKEGYDEGSIVFRFRPRRDRTRCLFQSSGRGREGVEGQTGADTAEDS